MNENPRMISVSPAENPESRIALLEETVRQQRAVNQTNELEISRLQDLVRQQLTAMERQQGPAANDLAAVTHYWEARRTDLERQVSEIEEFIGFITVSEALAVRVSKIEQFLGLKG